MNKDKMVFLMKRMFVRGPIMAGVFALAMAFFKEQGGLGLQDFNQELFMKYLQLGLVVFPLANLLSGLVIWNVKERTKQAQEVTDAN